LIFKPQINRKTVTAQLIGTYIKIILPLNITPTQKQKACSTVLSRIFSEYFSAYVKKRVDDLNDIHFKKNIGEINMRHNHSNWGSCSSSNNISLSSRLLLAPDFVLDYIIIHELAHLIEHNHSHRFWDQVERAMPNYMEAEKWLKKFGDTCHW
jgi:predicted metal-dependent hydrolase